MDTQEKEKEMSLIIHIHSNKKISRSTLENNGKGDQLDVFISHGRWMNFSLDEFGVLHVRFRQSKMIPEILEGLAEYLRNVNPPEASDG